MANESSIEKRILDQVEFYFSDSNLPKDKFLLEQTKKNPEEWVPISIIASFSRIKSISDQLPVVVAALKQSESLLEVKDDGQNPPLVRRKVPLPENLNEVAKKRTIYAKSFPLDSTVDSVKQFFSPYGKVLSVRLRYYIVDKQRKLKGSVLVEFSSPEEAAAVLAKPLTLGDKPLTLQSMESWEQEKKTESESKKDLKNKRKEKPQTSQNDDDDPEEEVDEKKDDAFTDTILRLENIPADGVSREDIIKAFNDQKFVTRFVDFNRGQTDGYVRLASSEAKAAAQQMTDKGLELGGQKVAVRALTEEEHQAYIAKIRDNMQQKSKRNRGGKGGRGGRGGRGGGGGRGNKKNAGGNKGRKGGNEPAAKKVKTDGDAVTASS